MMSAGHEQALLALVLLGFVAAAIYMFVIWLIDAQRTADPWGEEVTNALESDEAVEVCHHCLTPQHHNGWFCPECGATVGNYCNYLPFVYVFSQGEVLRAGVMERLRPRALIVVGYVLLSLATLAVVAPVYWFWLYRNLHRTSDPTAEAGAA